MSNSASERCLRILLTTTRKQCHKFTAKSNNLKESKLKKIQKMRKGKIGVVNTYIEPSSQRQTPQEEVESILCFFDWSACHAARSIQLIGKNMESGKIREIYKDQSLKCKFK